MPESVTKQEKGGTVDRLVAILFAVFFLFHSVDSPIPGISHGELLLAIATAFTFFNGAGSYLQIHCIHLDMLIFALICLLVTLAAAPFQPVFSGKDFAIRAIRWVFYIGCAMILGERINLKQLRDAILAIAVMACILLIFQVVLYRLTGQAMTFHIGKQTLGGAAENIYINGKLAGRIFRFSSFFSEPAHFSYYVILSLALVLFYREALDMGAWTIAGIAMMFLALVCCTSTYAILLTAMLILSFLILFIKYHGISRRCVRWAMLLLLLGVILLFAFSNSALGSYFITKIASLGNTSRTGFVWEQSHLFSNLQKWFGVGVGNEEAYYRYMTNSDIGYVNSVSLVFLYCGFTGVVLILLFFVKAWTDSRGPARVLLVLFAGMSLYSTAFFSTIMVLYTVVIAAGEKMPAWCSPEGSEKLS